MLVRYLKVIKAAAQAAPGAIPQPAIKKEQEHQNFLATATRAAGNIFQMALPLQEVRIGPAPPGAPENVVNAEAYPEEIAAGQEEQQLEPADEGDADGVEAQAVGILARLPDGAPDAPARLRAEDDVQLEVENAHPPNNADLLLLQNGKRLPHNGVLWTVLALFTILQSRLIPRPWNKLFYHWKIQKLDGSLRCMGKTIWATTKHVQRYLIKYDDFGVLVRLRRDFGSTWYKILYEDISYNHLEHHGWHNDWMNDEQTPRQLQLFAGSLGCRICLEDIEWRTRAKSFINAMGHAGREYTRLIDDFDEEDAEEAQPEADDQGAVEDVLEPQREADGRVLNDSEFEEESDAEGAI